MSTTNTAPFVCLETFHPDNTTSCMRYEKVKHCIQDGAASNIPFLCVGQDTISIGGGGPLKPLPLNLTSSVFLCNLSVCPNASPAKESKPGKKGSSDNSSASSVKSISLSGVFVLALIVSQAVLF
ncbi:hypothetical protein BGZ97_013056 [Linnemannia gamsii]|jgi:hypothetical protein|uniref:Uncharacterized protein n=1 Tax=Linnemannia gamsii TaxID=64522 RepID=A0A9P6R4P4_9FUNG|nr:hypothetical protein BGZ97_013056 [Linnemannia gamsii]